MKKYPPHLVESFLQYAETLNMVRASDALQMSQPALSRQLRDFEALVGQSIFKAQGRNKVLTPLGNQIFNNLKNAWPDYSGIINQAVDSFADGPKAPIKIYGPSDMVARLATKLNTSLPLDFIPAESEDIEKLLASNEISLGIGRVVNSNSELVSKFFSQLDFHLVFPKSWDIEESTFGIRILKKLAEHPRISFRRDTINKNLIQLLEKAQIQNHRIIPNWWTILQLVTEGKGWALAPIDVLESYTEFKKQISIVKVPHEVVAPVKYNLLYRKDISKIPWVRKLIEETLQK